MCSLLSQSVCVCVCVSPHYSDLNRQAGVKPTKQLVLAAHRSSVEANTRNSQTQKLPPSALQSLGWWLMLLSSLWLTASELQTRDCFSVAATEAKMGVLLIDADVQQKQAIVLETSEVNQK